MRSNIGNAITFFRRRKKLSQKQFIEATGFAPSTIYAIEKGSTWPEEHTLLKILAVLEVTPERFFLQCFKDRNHAVTMHIFRAKTILDRRVYKPKNLKNVS